MKKNDVLAAISGVRRSCEIANSCLRSTANRYDNGLRAVRPTTEQERRDAIMDAWLWVHDARARQEEAESAIRRYLKQEGIETPELQAFIDKRKRSIHA